MPLQTDLARIVELAGTDPRYKDLGEALTEPCNRLRDSPEWVERDDDLGILHHWQHPDNCPSCGGSGRVLRSWDKLPQGALTGVLKQWAETMWLGAMLGKTSWGLLAANLTDCFGEPDCNEQAAKVVLEFVEKMKGEAHDSI